MIRSVNMGIKNSRTKKSLYREKADFSMLEDIINWEVVMLSEENNYPALFLLDKIKG